MRQGQPSAKRLAAEKAGRRAETVAVLYLRCQGYRILHRRFKGPGGEIDLIAQRGQSLVFIEVKYRADLCTALSSVTPRQQRRIEQAARAFCASRSHYAGCSLRFDVIALAPRHWPRHIKSAWRPGASI